MNLNAFKKKVTELYHTMIGFRSMVLLKQGLVTDNQLFDIACNAVGSEDEYFINWLAKNQDFLDYQERFEKREYNSCASEFERLNILLMKEILIYGNIAVTVGGYKKQPIAMTVKQFMKDEDLEFEESLFTFLLEKVIDLRKSGHIELPYLTLVSCNDKKVLIALDVFCKEYYTRHGSLLYPGLITGSGFSPSLSDEEKKKESDLIEHLFLDVKIEKLKKRQEEIKNELRELEGSKQKCKDLLKEYLEVKNKQADLENKIRQAFNGSIIYK